MRLELNVSPFQTCRSSTSESGEYQAVSFWQETLDVTPGEPLHDDRSCDVAIIGGGFTGLSVAHELSAHEPGLDVVLLEKETVGFGASGRNGGFVMPLIGWDLIHVKEKLGPQRTQKLYELMYDAVGSLRQLINRHNLDCDMKETGYLLLNTCRAREEHARREHELARSMGFERRWIDGETLPDYIRSDSFHSGLFDPNAFTINPAKLARERKRLVESRGVSVYEQTPVVILEDGAPVQLTTPSGNVRADDVVVALNGYANALGFRDARQIPVHTYIVLTEPLRVEQLEEIGWAKKRTSLETSRNFIHYFRLTPDNRIAFGGEDARLYYGGQLHDRDRTVEEALKERFYEYFPTLRDVSFEHAWGGVLGVTMDMFPNFGVTGEQDSIHYAGSYCGHGVSLSNYAGKILLPQLLGEDPEEISDPFFHGHSSPLLPPDPLRYLGMQVYRKTLHAVDWWHKA